MSKLSAGEFVGATSSWQVERLVQRAASFDDDKDIGLK